MRYIYVSGPYTSDPEANVQAAMIWTHRLLAAGFYPFCPHLSHFLELQSPQPYEVWMTLDLKWIERCDAVLRFPGESPGAEREVARAHELGIPVFYNLAALQEWAAFDTPNP